MSRKTKRYVWVLNYTLTGNREGDILAEQPTKVFDSKEAAVKYADEVVISHQEKYGGRIRTNKEAKRYSVYTVGNGPPLLLLRSLVLIRCDVYKVIFVETT